MASSQNIAYASIVVFSLFCILLPHTGLAQEPKSDVLRVYWDEDLTEFFAYPTNLPDTLKAYLVLENPSLTGVVDRFNFHCSTQYSMTFTPGTGTVVTNIENDMLEVRVTLNAPVPLTQKTLLGTYYVPVGVEPIARRHSIFFGYYSITDPENEGTGTNRPFSCWPCAWINPGTPNPFFEPTEIEFGERGYGTTTTRSAYLRNLGDAPFFFLPEIGPGSDAFSFISAGGLDVLDFGAGQSVYFGFSPEAVADYSGHFSAAPGIDLPLQGTGRIPVYSLSGPDTVVIDSAPLGHTVRFTVPVRNDGDFPVAANMISFPDSCSYLSQPYPSTRETLPGNLVEGRFDFEPTTLGIFECDMVFGDSLLSVHLIAEAVQVPVLATQDSLDFGILMVLDQISRLVTIQNPSEFETPLEIHLENSSTAFTLSDGATAELIAPNSELTFEVGFNPQTVGLHQARIILGPNLPVISLSGYGSNVDYLLESTPAVLQFSPTNPGESDTQTFSITNRGLSKLSIDPSVDVSFVSDLGPAGELESGESMDISATYSPPQYGQYEFRITLNSEHDMGVHCVAPPRLSFPAGQNRLGIFFDQDFVEDKVDVWPAPQSVFAYLVMFDPSDHSGVGGWECSIDVSPGATLASYNLEGGVVNLGAGNEFIVSSGSEPLPNAPTILLGTLEFTISDPGLPEIHMRLGPTDQPSIPGMMSWVPGQSTGDHTPLISGGWQSTTARIRIIDVGIADSPPNLVNHPGKIILSWPNTAPPGSGYHVYRNTEGGSAKRLNRIPLVASGETVSYQDTPPYLARGTLLHYSYRLVADDMVLLQSPEISTVFQVRQPETTRVLANLPNPFNSKTLIRFDLARDSQVQVDIFDVSGRRVRQLQSAYLLAGPYQLEWSGEDDQGRALPSGSYYVRLKTDQHTDSRKVLLLK